jgi:hypothetical protein
VSRQTAAVHLGRHHGRDAWILQSPALRVTVMQVGGHVAELVLRGDGEINPLWQQARPTIDPTEFIPEVHAGVYGGGPAARVMSGLLGHSLCFPYWGNPSEAEYRCGMSFHGETGLLRWSRVAAETPAGSESLALAVDLPESQTRFTRTLTVFGDEPVAYFDEEASNLSRLDRPVGWCEHVTLGPPFLKKGVTFFDATLTRGRVNGACEGEELRWPEGENGVGLHVVRDVELSRFVDNFLVDPAREFGYFTAVNAESRLLFGYLFRRTEFRWLNLWEANSPAADGRPAMLARGLELSNTPAHGSLRTLVRQPTVFGVPAYEWLDAGGRLAKRFCAFGARVPGDFSGVRDVEVTPGFLEIVERNRGRSVRVPFRHERLAGSTP